MPPEKPWTAGRVAERLGLNRSTVHRIPRDRLPYRQGEATPERPQPRRYYDPADVERYALGMEAERPGPGMEERLAAVESDVTSIRAWLETHDRRPHPDDDPDPTPL